MENFLSLTNKIPKTINKMQPIRFTQESDLGKFDEHNSDEANDENETEVKEITSHHRQKK